MIIRAGGTSELLETPGNPIVYGRMDEGADYTLLIYSMYDVLPAEEEDWISDPWMAKIHPFRDYGDCIIGRGAVNTKGPTAAFFRALMAYRKLREKLPVNLVFLIEGRKSCLLNPCRIFWKRIKKNLQIAMPCFSRLSEKRIGLHLSLWE